MPDSKTTVLTAMAAFASNDVLMVVDVSDTTMAASGTSKAATLSQLAAAVKPLLNAAIGSVADGATITFDMAVNNWWTVAGGLGGNRTLAVSNVAPGQQFTITLPQDGTGSRTVTWFSGITWIGTGGSPPTLTTTPGKKDVFTFKNTGSGTYDGFVAGQNG